MPNVWRATRSTDTTADALLWGDQLWSVPSTAGVEINQQTALGAVCVMACVMMLTEDVAKLPVSLYRLRSDSSREQITDHPLALLLEEPNEWQDWLEFAEMVQVGLVLRGNGYAVIIRDWRGRPVKLVPINPDRVALWEAPTGELFYRVTPFGLHEMAELRDMPFLIPAADMFHLRGLSVNGLLGASRIAVARDAIGLTLGAGAPGGAVDRRRLEAIGRVVDRPKARRSNHRTAQGSLERTQCRAAERRQGGDLRGRAQVDATVAVGAGIGVHRGAAVPGAGNRADVPHPAAHDRRTVALDQQQHRPAGAGIRQLHGVRATRGAGR